MLVLIILGFIFALTMGYFFLMFFFPEWVGISGEDTKKAIESHKEQNPSDQSDNTQN